LNATYVDVYGAVNPNEAGFTLINTWQTDPVNYVHLNDAGYAAVGDELIRTASGQLQVLEVNSNPAWRGLQGVADVNIAHAIAEDFLKTVLAHRARARVAP
jgi:hypothetical protein